MTGTSFHQAASSTGNDEWPTPQWLVDTIASEFGPFDLDPAATSDNAKAPACFTAEVDGLAQPWQGVVWLNPPYSQHAGGVGRWLAKAQAEVALGHAVRVVALVNARVGSVWWETYSRQAAFTRMLGRLQWVPGVHRESVVASALLVFGKMPPGRHGVTFARCDNPGCARPYRRLSLSC